MILRFFVTYAAHLVDGNLLTDLLSIGGKTSETGEDPPAPAIVGGLDTHACLKATLVPLVVSSSFPSIVSFS